MRSLIAVCAVSVLLLASPSSDADAQRRSGLSSVDAGRLPPDFQGSITYTGTHQGTLTRGRRTQQLGGSLSITLTFDGERVTARYSGTGGINNGSLTGTRSGSRCRLVDDRGGDQIDAQCTATAFNGLSRQSGPTQSSVVRFEARAPQPEFFARQSIPQAANQQSQSGSAGQRGAYGCPQDPAAAKAAITKRRRIERAETSVRGPLLTIGSDWSIYEPGSATIYGYRPTTIALNNLTGRTVVINYRLPRPRKVVQSAVLASEGQTCRPGEIDCVFRPANRPDVLVKILGDASTASLVCVYDGGDDEDW